jgi:hypothetical protein
MSVHERLFLGIRGGAFSESAYGGTSHTPATQRSARHSPPPGRRALAAGPGQDDQDAEVVAYAAAADPGVHTGAPEDLVRAVHPQREQAGLRVELRGAGAYGVPSPPAQQPSDANERRPPVLDARPTMGRVRSPPVPIQLLRWAVDGRMCTYDGRARVRDYL